MPLKLKPTAQGQELERDDASGTQLQETGTQRAQTVTARRISEQMKANRMSAHGLSRAAGLGKGAVSAILSGHTRNVRAGTLAKIAQALGVSVAYLAGDAGAADDPTGAEPWSTETEPCPVMRAAVKAAQGSRPGLRAYVAGPGSAGLGVAAGARVVVDTLAGDADGVVFAVHIPGRGGAIRYRARPYWVGFDGAGGVTDLDAPGVRILGAVVATMAPLKS